MLDLFNLTKFSEEKQKEIQKKLYALSHELLKCYDIHQNFTEELNKEIEKIQPFDSSATIYHNPHMINLELFSENFLYQAKNYLRDLGQFLNFFYPNLKLSEAPFNPQSKKNIFDTFLCQERPNLKPFFDKDRIWINELISKRNAVEHPGGLSGKLHILNFQITQAHEIIPPVWYREINKEKASPVTDILQDMTAYLENLFTFSEEIIIHFCIMNNFLMDRIVLCIIPEEERNKNCPIKYRATLADK